jgi:hypothetical protein
MNKNYFNNILHWLKNRCVFVYKESNTSKTIRSIDQILGYINDLDACNIDKNKLDAILSKYYFDFNMEKSQKEDGFSIGFAEKDRESLRSTSIAIHKDIINSILESHIINQAITPLCNDIDFVNNEYIDNFTSNTF